MKMKKTKKQIEIMRHVIAAVSRGRPITAVELHEKLSYECTRTSALCSIRYLIQHGMLLREIRGPRSMYLTPTVEGFERFKAPPPS